MTKKDKYEELLPQIKALIEGEKNTVGVLANVSAAIRSSLGYFWIGFYIVKDDELQLGPFQGDVACYHIPYGKGVCGAAWQRGETIIVDDVEEFPGHIACSSLSRSEIVVPVRDNEGKIWAVLDIDSINLREFDEIDKEYLEQVATLLSSWG
ncbi:MAG: GAF domain-containing protein [Prevotella sp.]|nr:GAF domain-containing protein [Prevotella sp.]